MPACCGSAVPKHAALAALPGYTAGTGDGSSPQGMGHTVNGLQWKKLAWVKTLQKNGHTASGRQSWGFSASQCTGSSKPRMHFGVRPLIAEDEQPGFELLLFPSYQHNLWIFLLFCLSNTPIKARTEV